MRHELGLFLAANARKNPFVSKPLVLKAEFKTLPAVSDADKNVYEIDMSQLISFRDHFNDKSCNFFPIQTNMSDFMTGSSTSNSMVKKLSQLNSIVNTLF